MLHSNTNSDNHSNNQAAKIKPPRLHGQRVGCLSTRSPHRPNNIGLSVCEVAEVGANYIDVLGCDMMHGTPVLDVKPYIPYDVVPSDCELAMARAADGSPLATRKLHGAGHSAVAVL